MRRPWLTDEVLVQTLDRSPDAVVLFTAGGKVVYANDAVAGCYGWTPDQIVGTNIVDLLHPDDVAVALASVDAFDVQGSRARTPARMRFLWPDDAYVELEVNGNPIDVADGSVLYSMYARRADEQRILTDTIAALARGAEIDTVLGLVHRQLGWSIDSPLNTFVWEADDGGRLVVGDDIPPELSGFVTGATRSRDIDGSPWTAGWKGEDTSGAAEELPEPLRGLALARGLLGYRVHPVRVESGRVGVLVTMWDTGRNHPLPVFDNRLQFVSGLLELTLRFAEQQSRLRHEAAHDALTGLANRRTFFSALRGSASRGEPGTTAVIYIDLDDFKPINDQWGHGAGDLLLIEVASRLRGACRDGDVVARLGGDEFAVVCPDCGPAVAAAVGERFLAALRAPIDIGGATVTVHASVGVAVGHGDAAGLPDAVESLAQKADDALYEAKRAGGRRVVLRSSP